MVLAVLLVAAPLAMGQRAVGGNVTTSELKSDSLGAGIPSAAKSDRTAGATPTILASSLLGQTLYARDGQRIGKISDVVMTHNLDSLLAIVGVGGFLGFGTKDVAIPKDKIAVSEDESGELRFTAATTTEQLQQAPIFDRTALMR